MWMNVPRIHVRTVQSAPIHMETIIARAAMLSLENDHPNERSRGNQKFTF